MEAIFIIIGIIALAFVALMVISFWIIYTKAGKPGWACIIPIYSFIVQQQIIGKPWWWLFLMIIPIVNIVFAIWMTNLLSKSFGHGVGFTLGLLFLGPVFFPLLAFGSSQYQGPAGLAK